VTSILEIAVALKEIVIYIEGSTLSNLYSKRKNKKNIFVPSWCSKRSHHSNSWTLMICWKLLRNVLMFSSSLWVQDSSWSTGHSTNKFI